MKTHTLLVDTALFVLALTVLLKLLVVMAGTSSLSLLSALPREFQYLTALLF